MFGARFKPQNICKLKEKPCEFATRNPLTQKIICELHTYTRNYTARYKKIPNQTDKMKICPFDEHGEK
ncbi:MAG: hypothetical protein A2231_03120 [Candidatus Firestonebacteria bacterium RIFOXYA2_FULL_40_8]|nr:MAG: hypothetical protein A2231_03120 [Candidatus Firestonebacteria bacterium RIFOXYA2_FULL_40_8]